MDQRAPQPIQIEKTSCSNVVTGDSNRVENNVTINIFLPKDADAKAIAAILSAVCSSNPDISRKTIRKERTPA